MPGSTIKKTLPQVNCHGFPAAARRAVTDAAVRALASRPGCVRSSVNFVLVTDAEIRRLNRRFRRVDRVTDVISFLVDHCWTGRAYALAGDVYIAEGRSKKQARACGHPWTHELAYLAMHGALHLAGYTDYDPREKKRMFAVQDRLWEQWRGRC